MVKNTLNVGRISEGFVLDHIQAGRSMDIYKYLHLDRWTAAWPSSRTPRAARWGKRTS